MLTTFATHGLKQHKNRAVFFIYICLMAGQSSYLLTLQDISGNYYQATKSQYGIWTTTNDTALFSPIKNLPDGWDKVAIVYSRDLNYMGIFRSSTTDALLFSTDGRAILQYIRDTQGMQGYCLTTMWQWNDKRNQYIIFYQCQADFSTFDDDMMRFKLSTQLLETYLKRYWDAFGSTQVNIPCFIDTSDGAGTSFIPDPALKWIVDDGIKLRYQQVWTSAATSASFVKQIFGGFNGGRTGTGVNQGVHSIISMVPYNITQNNGATTFIANDILQQFILAGTQNPGANVVTDGARIPLV